MPKELKSYEVRVMEVPVSIRPRVTGCCVETWIAELLKHPPALGPKKLRYFPERIPLTSIPLGPLMQRRPFRVALGAMKPA